jgi:hypothetical protein
MHDEKNILAPRSAAFTSRHVSRCDRGVPGQRSATHVDRDDEHTNHVEWNNEMEQSECVYFNLGTSTTALRGVKF